MCDPASLSHVDIQFGRISKTLELLRVMYSPRRKQTSHCLNSWKRTEGIVLAVGMELAQLLARKILNLN